MRARTGIFRKNITRRKKPHIKYKRRNIKQKSNWIECAELPLPSTFTSKLIKLNSNHLIAITTTDSLYIYNIIDDQWKTPYGDWAILKYKIKSIAIDYIDHEIYFFAIKRNTGMIFTFEYNTLIKTNMIPQFKTIKLIDYFNSEAITSIFANNQLHLLRAYDKKTFHYIFNIKSSTLTKIFEFPETKYFQPTLIHIKSNNTLMLFGAMKTTYVYSFENGQWSKHYNGHEIRSLLQIGYQDCYATPNEKHLIVFGGYGLYDKITLININYGNLTVEKELINGPVTLECKAMLMEHGAIDDILVIGYYRKCWIDMNKPILPNDIVKLICAIAQRDAFIHYFPIYKRMNYKMKLEYVIEFSSS